jgi:hypothetical protein
MSSNKVDPKIVDQMEFNGFIKMLIKFYLKLIGRLKVEQPSEDRIPTYPLS